MKRNVSLLPGSNFLELQGFLKPENLELAGIFFSQYIQGLNSSVSVHGLNASVDSPDWIKYMVSILNVCFQFLKRFSKEQITQHVCF